MALECEVRVAEQSDAQDISRIILRTLRETNAGDYSPDIIAQVERSFSPAAVLGLMEHRTVFVAVAGQKIVGTAGLEGRAVRSVFVSPDVQGHGVGRRLMAEIERTAREAGVAILAVPSSVTAVSFYAKLGFAAVRESYHGEERTIIMERCLSPFSDSAG